MRTRVYIDGFNLYYGCLKGTPRRWCNVEKLAELLLRKDDTIEHVRYFTALAKDRPGHPGTEARQQTYLRALKTLPNLTIHLGQFRSHPVHMKLATPPAQGSAYVEVIKTEEKGSDVNLATMMLIDGYRGLYEKAAVISNDSDLRMPVQMVRTELKKTVVTLHPVALPRRRLSTTLSRAATYHTVIRGGPCDGAIFGNPLQDAKGSITCPKEWR